MDIAGPTPEHEVARAPWLVPLDEFDFQAAIEDFLTRHPKSTANEIVQEFAKCGIDLNGSLVAEEMIRLRTAKR